MSKTKKTILSFLLILFILVPILFFLIYPKYNDIILNTRSFNSYNLSKESTVKIFTQVSPLRESYKEEVLGLTSIEESLKEQTIILGRKILEEQDTILHLKNLNIEGKIYQGESSVTMDKGFWHFPISKFPGEKGNAVIIGHRFMNIPPAKDTLFNLDNTEVGDEITVTHQQGEFTYIVVEIKEVLPNDITVIQDSDDYRLTLITCTPLWTSEKRLVVIAKLDKLYKKV
jgi:sortase A